MLTPLPLPVFSHLSPVVLTWITWGLVRSGWLGLILRMSDAA